MKLQGLNGTVETNSPTCEDLKDWVLGTIESIYGQTEQRETTEYGNEVWLTWVGAEENAAIRTVDAYRPGEINLYISNTNKDKPLTLGFRLAIQQRIVELLLDSPYTNLGVENTVFTQYVQEREYTFGDRTITTLGHVDENSLIITIK